MSGRSLTRSKPRLKIIRSKGIKHLLEKRKFYLFDLPSATKLADKFAEENVAKILVRMGAIRMAEVAGIPIK